MSCSFFFIDFFLVYFIIFTSGDTMDKEFMEMDSYDFDFVYHVFTNSDYVNEIEDESVAGYVLKKFRKDMVDDYLTISKTCLFNRCNIALGKMFPFMFSPSAVNYYMEDLKLTLESKNIIYDYLCYLDCLCDEVNHDNFLDVLVRFTFLEYYYQLTIDFFEEKREFLSNTFDGFDYYPDHTPVFHQPEKVFEYLDKIKDKKINQSMEKVKKK